MAMVPGEPIGRRGFLATSGAVGAGLGLAGCAPAAPVSAPAAPQAGKAEWERQWEELVAAARKEGALTVMSSPVATGYDKAVQDFSQAFRGIDADLRSFPGVADYAPKLTQERQAAIYSFDVALVPTAPEVQDLINGGMFDPVRPLMVRPDVLDEKAWIEGFDRGFQDLKRATNYAHLYQVNRPFLINTDLVKEGEIKTVQDLLDPKWKGKIFMADPRTGAAFLSMTVVRRNHGDDVVKRLIVDQEPIFSRDRRQLVELVMRGRYPIGLPSSPAPVIKEFRDAGLAGNLKQPELPKVSFVVMYSVMVFNRAPHPNAAKLFINWLLTKESQAAISKYVAINSRRSDVPPVDPETVRTPGVEYVEMNREEIYPEIVKTQEFLAELVKQRGG